MEYLKRIRELREDNDYSQREIAELLNIGQRTYADYEYGKTRIPLDSMIKLAQFYDVDLNFICGVCNIQRKFPT